MHGEVIHYRVDTRDALDSIENSFLVGGETVVFEQAYVESRATRSWALASVKGPQLWTEAEVRLCCVANVCLFWARCRECLCAVV